MRDLSWIISETVAKLPALFAAQANLFEQYRRRELSDIEAHDLLIRLYDSKAVNLTDLPALLREWREPSHPEFSLPPIFWTQLS